eukprot:2866301-Pleurochrysis_carterae.AAC.1
MERCEARGRRKRRESWGVATARMRISRLQSCMLWLLQLRREIPLQDASPRVTCVSDPKRMVTERVGPACSRGLERTSDSLVDAQAG